MQFNWSLFSIEMSFHETLKKHVFSLWCSISSEHSATLHCTHSKRYFMVSFIIQCSLNCDCKPKKPHTVYFKHDFYAYDYGSRTVKWKPISRFIFCSETVHAFIVINSKCLFKRNNFIYIYATWCQIKRKFHPSRVWHIYKRK